MLKSFKYINLLFLLIFLTSCAAAQPFHTQRVTLSFGVTLGSYSGADFGSTYAMRFFPSNSYEYGNNYYNNNYYNNNYGYNPNSFYNPIVFDLGGEIHVNEHLSIGVETSFLWHTDGYPGRGYVSGNLSGNRSYVDRWDNAMLYAVPVFLNLKIYPMGQKFSPVYISAGYGQQYTNESVDRVRQIYDNEYTYYGNDYLIGHYSDTKWLPGIKLAIGARYSVGPFMSNETELKITNFFPQRNINSPLAMNSTTNITFIGITTKICLSF